METVAFQSYVFMSTLYGGIIIGILYDIYRVLKGTRRSERLITSFWDILFLIAVLFVMLWAIFSVNYGQLRLYVFVGFLVGFYLYEKILSRIIVALFLFIKRSITGFFRTTNSVLVLPLKFVYNIMWYPTTKFIKNRKVGLKKAKKLPKILLKDSKKYYNLVIRKSKQKSNK